VPTGSVIVIDTLGGFVMRRRSFVVMLLAVAVLAVPASSASAATTTVVVQGGTTISDSGLLQNVIIPGFHKAFPQYTLQFVPVGTGQALTNAELGEGDAVFTHNPTAEEGFVAAGYSYEKYGRAIMYSDFVTVGPKTDPAGVATSAPHNAVAAFEAIAAAGAAGKANFVSRGDGSGTNLKELSIWALTNVPLNNLHEPGTPGTNTDAPWYHKAGLGQAQTLQVASQCPTSTFTGGGCYAIADRGTFNILVQQKTITNMKIVSQTNPAPAPGGPGLLENPYHAYAVNPAAVSSSRPNDNLAGALAFLSYLTSKSFQTAVSNYPKGANFRAFHPDAYPVVTPLSAFPTSVAAGTSVHVTGKIASALPFSPPLGTTYLPVPPWPSPAPAATVNLIRKSNGNIVATGFLDASGNYSLTFRARAGASDTYQIQFPQYVDLRPITKTLGALTVT
jgi:tungstate transport system substrate-binding protein